MSRSLLPLIAVAVVAAGSSAAAQQSAPCSARAEILKHLSNEYAEAPVAMGLANNGGVLEILSSRAGQSWTIILTLPNGIACLVASGENWESLPAAARGPGA